MKIDSLTWYIFAGTGFVLLAWELVLIALRTKRVRAYFGLPGIPRTISQVVMARSLDVNCAPFVWGALATHYFPFWPTTSNPYSTWGYSVAIVVAVALFVLDAALSFLDVSWVDLPRWARWARWPFLWLVLGLLTGTFLFAQRVIQPWEW